ncbi:hypothetical protein C8F01DRAFT_1309945 [Mycena amicta]|nr:hypothetical protein C8F01DRAFT_1309945 [Mycena amicta]
MHTVHQIAMTPKVVVFMGSRRLEAAHEAIKAFDPPIHASSEVIPVQLDIADAASISGALHCVKSSLEARNVVGLDVVINNAGISADSLAETYAVNVFGTTALTDAFHSMINTGGAIIQVSSIMGSLGTLPNHQCWSIYTAYNSSKTAMNALTVNWALQEKRAGSGIRVLSVCPGPTKTEMNPDAEVDPAKACRIIVHAALEEDGRTGVFYDKHGDLPW